MEQINGDLSQRASMHTVKMEWTPSPSGTVWRKRLHLVGEPESGQVTSVVRFAPGAEFSAHDHPEGEEILVLEGVFADERGDWPAGSYLLNPEGSRHHPSSSEGCLLFVKLRQYGGPGRESVALRTADLDEERGDAEGVRRRWLYRHDSFPDSMRIETWSAGASIAESFAGGVELYVLEGSFKEGGECFEEGSWLRLPMGSRLIASAGEGCVVYLKAGGVAELRSGPL